MDILDEVQEELRDPRYSDHVSRFGETDLFGGYAITTQRATRCGVSVGRDFDDLLSAVRNDKEYFMSNFETFFNEFPHQYVAIRNRNVIGANHDIRTLIRQIRTDFGKDISCFIAKVDEDYISAQEDHGALIDDGVRS